MKPAFADTGYDTALLNPEDDLHSEARVLAMEVGSRRIVTTDLVLIEYLNDFSGRGSEFRRMAVELVDATRKDPKVEIVPLSGALFEMSYQLYRDRTDKDWSLTDCASFLVMKERGLIDVLAYDVHFEQAGFKALLR